MKDKFCNICKSQLVNGSCINELCGSEKKFCRCCGSMVKSGKCVNLVCGNSEEIVNNLSKYYDVSGGFKI